MDRLRMAQKAEWSECAASELVCLVCLVLRLKAPSFITFFVCIY